MNWITLFDLLSSKDGWLLSSSVSWKGYSEYCAFLSHRKLTSLCFFFSEVMQSHSLAATFLYAYSWIYINSTITSWHPSFFFDWCTTAALCIFYLRFLWWLTSFSSKVFIFLLFSFGFSNAQNWCGTFLSGWVTMESFLGNIENTQGDPEDANEQLLVHCCYNIQSKSHSTGVHCLPSM